MGTLLTFYISAGVDILQALPHIRGFSISLF